MGRSWSDRRELRAEILMPPEPHRGREGEHVVEIYGERARVRWVPGLDIWFDPMGRRVNAERAIEVGWRYVGPIEERADG